MAQPVDELTVLREHLERYRAVTLQTLDLVPESKLDWRPAENLWSFAQHFFHIGAVEDFYSHGLLVADWNFGRFKASQTLTRDFVRQHLNQTRAFLLARLDAVGPAQLDSIVSVPNIPVEWPLRSWLWYIVEHEMHHKSQLALYLRQVGVTPPFFAYALPPGIRPDIF